MAYSVAGLTGRGMSNVTEPPFCPHALHSVIFKVLEQKPPVRIIKIYALLSLEK